MTGSDSGGYRRPVVIFNPASGRGRGVRRMEVYLRMLEGRLGAFERAVTTRAGEESEIADRALAEGADLVVAVGGDGTWSNVADRIVASDRTGVRFGILPSGTGNDFAKGLGIAYGEPEAAVEALAAGTSVRVDVGRITVTLAGGGTRTRHFLLVTGFGIDSAILETVNRARFLSGNLLYKAAALQRIFTYDGLRLSHSEDGGGSRSAELLMISVCNGSSIGGSFLIAPEASLTDGALDVCTIRNASRLARLRVFDLVGKGRHAESDLVELFRIRRMEIVLDAPQPFQVDGELQPGSAVEAVVEVLPGALEVAAPPVGSVR